MKKELREDLLVQYPDATDIVITSPTGPGEYMGGPLLTAVRSSDNSIPAYGDNVDNHHVILGTRVTELDRDAEVLDDEVIFPGLPVEYLADKVLLEMPGVAAVETAHNPAAYEAFEINIEEFLAG